MRPRLELLHLRHQQHLLVCAFLHMLEAAALTTRCRVRRPVNPGAAMAGYRTAKNPLVQLKSRLTSSGLRANEKCKQNAIVLCKFTLCAASARVCVEFDF